MNLFHLSQSNLTNRTLKPRIPSNWLIDNGFEDNKSKRICFAPSIDKSLIAMSANLENKEFYVHVPKHNPTRIKKPTKKEVPDSIITGEIWVLEEVELKCIGKIRVTDSIDKPYKYSFGNNNEYSTELYAWKWKWIEKNNSLLEFSIKLLGGL